MRAYEEAFRATSTPWAPWYIIPADHKWVMRALVSGIVTHTIKELKLKYPQVSDEQRKQLASARRALARE